MGRNRIFLATLRAGSVLALAGLLAVLASGTAARAASGHVVGPDGRPIRGARVCNVIRGAEQLCVDTDENGAYLLPGKPAAGLRIRIVAPRFLVQYVHAVDYAEPIVLRWAASLRVHVVDAVTGEPIPKGKVTLMTTSGRKLGPFPFNAAGLRLPRLHPGKVVPTAVAAGYDAAAGKEVSLVGGNLTEVTVKLRKTVPSAQGSGGDHS